MVVPTTQPYMHHVRFHMSCDAITWNVNGIEEKAFWAVQVALLDLWFDVHLFWSRHISLFRQCYGMPEASAWSIDSTSIPLG